MAFKILLTIDENVVHWPNKKMKKCTFLGSDNKRYQADITPGEAYLLLELKVLESKLTQWQLSSLTKKIEAFGDDRYAEGSHDESLSNMGEEL